MKRSLLLILVFLAFPAFSLSGQKLWDHGPLQVTANGHYLQHSDGTPFFWLGDTAWELFHRLTPEEIGRYLDNRSAKGFNVIQTVVLAEMDGLRTPNQLGRYPSPTWIPPVPTTTISPWSMR